MAPVGTVTVSEVSFASDTEARVAPKNTMLFAGTVLKLAPEIATVVPIAPEVGLKEVITGNGIYVNPARDAVPPGVVMLTLPDAPEAIMAVMPVSETTVNDKAAESPKLTAVAPVKLVPLIVIVVPTEPEVGLKELMTGCATAHAFAMLNNKTKATWIVILKCNSFLIIIKFLLRYVVWLLHVSKVLSIK